MNFIRRSFLLSVSITFLLGYAVLDIGHFVVFNLVLYEDYQQDRITGMINLAGFGQKLLQHDEALYLEKRLQESLALHEIDFYFIKKDGEVVSFRSVRAPLDTLLERISDRLPGQKAFDGDMPHIAFREGPYQLAIGTTPRRADYIWRIIEKNRMTLLFDIALVVLMASAIAFFFFNDIRALIQALKSPGKIKLKDLKPGIAEANLMLQGLKTYQSHVSQLEQKQGFLSRHIASALRTELESGRTPPYQFRCTMVRTDINHYSTIYSEQPVEEFMAVINEFFSRASKVIARYNGYVTDFVGDEIIYYFKDEDHEDSAAASAAAIREIHEIASSIHVKTFNQYGYPFRVKSAMASGSLRFGPHVNGFALSGGAFVETVRILSQVEEKSENSVYLPARLSERLRPVCETEIRKTVTLKGIPGTTELHSITRFIALSDLLPEVDRVKAAQLAYYRGTADVSAILTAASRAPLDVGLKMLKSLSLIAHPFSDLDVLKSYLSFVRSFSLSDKDSQILLSFAIALSRNLLARELYPFGLHEFLHECLRCSDRRTVANAVEALVHFDPERNSDTIIKLLKHPDNRVVANTLIKMGINDMGPEVISGLNAMIDSDEPRFKASGAYAVGVLAAYHRKANPLLLETHEHFAAITRKVKALLSHPDPMVRRQAAASQGKSEISTSQAA